MEDDNRVARSITVLFNQLDKEKPQGRTTKNSSALVDRSHLPSL